jgi:glycosyltransferase involved in cell wall biosynthesis
VKIVFLTAGTGSYYCGACMRDNALARELQRAGHEVTIAPMYLPLILDEASLAGSEKVPVFFGGINVYLQQKLGLARWTPAALHRLLNSTGLLKWAARHSHMTSAREHGAMTLEMLNVGSGRLRQELAQLLDWLVHTEKPDLICLSNALFAGFTAELKRQLRAPVMLFFQGEDSFLDGLPEPYRSQCWQALANHLPAADLLVAPSQFYADFMGARLALKPAAIEVVPNGIQLDGYSVVNTAPAPATIGYLARMCREKGLALFVDAFLHLTSALGDRTTRLKIGGAATAGDQPLIRTLQQKIAKAGLTARVDWAPNLTRESKITFLQSLTLFSVPAIYEEAFGLYVIEAMACGVPVIQPAAAAFPEIVAATGGGLCVPPRDAAALAHAWQQLLSDPGKHREFSRAGRFGVEKHFSAPTMAARFRQVSARLTPAAL